MLTFLSLSLELQIPVPSILCGYGSSLANSLYSTSTTLTVIPNSLGICGSEEEDSGTT